jgi:hypothetical protein
VLQAAQHAQLLDSRLLLLLLLGLQRRTARLSLVLWCSS